MARVPVNFLPKETQRVCDDVGPYRRRSNGGSLAVAIVVFGFATLDSPPASAQLPFQEGNRAFGIGAGWLISRPNEKEVVGVNARWLWYHRIVAYRLRSSLDFAGGGKFSPDLFIVNPEIGLATGLFSIFTGPAVAYFHAQKNLEFTTCCGPINNGYNPGFLLTWSASGGIEFRFPPGTALLLDVSGYLPIGTGINGFAGDPSAAFVRIEVGVLISKLGHGF